MTRSRMILSLAFAAMLTPAIANAQVSCTKTYGPERQAPCADSPGCTCSQRTVTIDCQDGTSYQTSEARLVSCDA